MEKYWRNSADVKVYLVGYGEGVMAGDLGKGLEPKSGDPLSPL